MSREIIFRAKCSKISKYAGKWVYGSLVISDRVKPDMIDMPRIVANNSDSPYSIDKYTIGQFTGLQDKNGKEIYEGDIVLQQGYNGKKIPMAVKFECGAFIVGYHEGSSTKRRPMLLNGQCEVIGNIYDNANLLEE